MAEVTALRNNALPYPVYGAPFGVVFPMLDADGDLVTGAATADAEVSKNGDTFADCTNESTEIATSSGMYYLLLTGTEMTADVVAVIAKSATAGMKTTPIVLYPRKLVSLRAGTVAANAADGTTLQLDSGASAVDDFYNGCLLVGTIDTVVEARVISDYVGSTKVCTVSPAFNTAPDNNDTFVVYLPEGKQVAQIASDSIVASVTGAVGSVTGAVGSVTGAVGSVTGAVGSVGAGGIVAATFGANAITAAKLDPDVTTELQAGLATAAALATAQTSIDDLPTNAELATSQAAADDATLAAIAALNNLSAAQVNTEVDTALSDIHLDHLLATTYDPASKPGAADALMNELVESDAGVARYTANALEQAPTGGSAPSAADVADAVWDEATAGHTTSGTFGEQLKTDVDAILDDTGTAGVIVASLAAGSITATVIATGAVDADALATDAVTEIQAAVAAGAVASVTGAVGSVTGNVGGNVTGSVGSVVGAVGSVTGNVGGNVTGTVASVVGAVGSVTGNVGGNVTGSVGSVVGAVGSVTGSVGSVAAGGIDLILDEAIGDGSLTMRQALRVLVAGMAGKLSGAATTTVTIRNVADSADVILATVDASGNRSSVTVTP